MEVSPCHFGLFYCVQAHCGGCEGGGNKNDNRGLPLAIPLPTTVPTLVPRLDPVPVLATRPLLKSCALRVRNLLFGASI